MNDSILRKMKQWHNTHIFMDSSYFKPLEDFDFSFDMILDAFSVQDVFEYIKEISNSLSYVRTSVFGTYEGERSIFDKPDYFGRTLMCSIISRDDMVPFNWLLDQGICDIGITTLNEDPLFECLYSKGKNAFTMFKEIASKTKTNIFECPRGNTDGAAIHEAIYYERLEMVKLLIQMGARLEHIDSRGKTAREYILDEPFGEEWLKELTVLQSQSESQSGSAPKIENKKIANQ